MTEDDDTRTEIDGGGRLHTDDSRLAALQAACGGEPGGPLAIPELRELVAKARQYRLRLARPFTAQDGERIVTGWAEIEPPADDAGTYRIAISGWRSETSPDDGAAAERRRREIERQLAEAVGRLDANQCLLSLETDAPDLAALSARSALAHGRPWTELVTLHGFAPGDTPHWRLADGALCRIDGSDRQWQVGIEPATADPPGGFVLYFAATQPLPEDEADGEKSDAPGLGRELAPAVRQPVERIISQAQAIGAQLAGPLPGAYAGYAGDIASAGEHLLGLLDDLADLDDVESDQFTPAAEDVELGDLARQASAMLSGRAGERAIVLVPPSPSEQLAARADRRRVLQVLLNLVGNALRYGPPDSQIWIRLDAVGTRALLTVADQGRGLDPAEQALIFEKFERLGRSGDGGSGLGLYISRRIARAMGGDLTVESAPGMGARFTLSLPLAAAST